MAYRVHAVRVLAIASLVVSSLSATSASAAIIYFPNYRYLSSTVEFTGTSAGGSDGSSLNTQNLTGYDDLFAETLPVSAAAPPSIAPASGSASASVQASTAHTATTLDTYATASYSGQLAAPACSSNCTSSGSDGRYSYSISFQIDTPYAYRYSFSSSRTGPTTPGYTIAVQSAVQDQSNTQFYYAMYTETESGGAGAPSMIFTGVLNPGLYTFYDYSNLALNLDGAGNGSGEFNVSSEFHLAPVPLPAAAWLLLSGLGGVAAFARRRRQTA